MGKKTWTGIGLLAVGGPLLLFLYFSHDSSETTKSPSPNPNEARIEDLKLQCSAKKKEACAQLATLFDQAGDAAAALRYGDMVCGRSYGEHKPCVIKGRHVLQADAERAAEKCLAGATPDCFVAFGYKLAHDKQGEAVAFLEKVCTSKGDPLVCAGFGKAAPPEAMATFISSCSEKDWLSCFKAAGGSGSMDGYYLKIACKGSLRACILAGVDALAQDQESSRAACEAGSESACAQLAGGRYGARKIKSAITLLDPLCKKGRKDACDAISAFSKECETWADLEC